MYTLAKMPQFKYRKDGLKNMRGTTLEVAMLAEVSAISSVYQCVTGPL